MQNESQGMYLHGQEIKAESFTPLEMVVADAVTLGVPIIATGAMQINKEISMFLEEEGRGELRPTDSIFAFPSRFKRSNTAIFKTKQQWEGTVIKLDDNRFTARVVDRTNPSNPAEAAVFEIDEISADDRRLIEPGAAFYWTFGTETSPAGRRKNVSFVNFRRFPAWSRSSFQAAEERAQQITSLFNQE